jgi:KDO2-lipid IV(A) lauroyltransferase
MAKSSLIRLLEAAPVFLAYGMFSLLPAGIASALGGALCRAIGPLLQGHRIALHNLSLAMPELGEGERHRIVRGMWDNLGRTFAEYAHLGRFGGPPRVDVTGAEHVRHLLASGAPAIFFAGHIANWEVPAMVVHANGIELPLVYRAPNNPFVDRLIRHARRPVTRVLVAKGGEGAKALIGLIKQGRSLGMLVDQKMNDGLAVPFFGRAAMTAPAMVRLAERFGLPLYPVEIERVNGVHFNVTIHPRFELPSTGDKTADTLAAMTGINALIESWIRKHPEQWLWVHRRWPESESKARR